MKKVLVIGDTILDYYVYGEVSRVNPEAPHSVVLDICEDEEVKLGGAANVAANIRGLAGDDVEIHYFGPTNELVRNLFKDYNIISLQNSDTEIITKTRYICKNHHLLRVDKDRKYKFHNTEYLFFKLLDDHYDLVVVSDYNKGVVNSDISNIVAASSKKALFDIKKAKNLFCLQNLNKNVILKCNAVEFESETIESAINSVYAIIKTKGKDGCEVYQSQAVTNIPAPYIENIADVVGAGDTFLAGMASNFLETKIWNPIEMAKFGNICASEKVKHFGTYVVNRKDIK